MILTKKTFSIYSLQAYTNNSCVSFKEFERDLRLLGLINRMLVSYKNGKDLNKRLLINYVICFFNVFKRIDGIELIFFKIPKEYHSTMKSVLLVLNLIPYEHLLSFDIDKIPVDNDMIIDLELVMN